MALSAAGHQEPVSVSVPVSALSQYRPLSAGSGWNKSPLGKEQ